MKKTTNSNPLKYFNDAEASRKKSVNAGNDKLVKAQVGVSVKPTKDSTKYYNDKADDYMKTARKLTNLGSTNYAGINFLADEGMKNRASAFRQSNKGQPGFDANGFPIKTKKK